MNIFKFIFNEFIAFIINIADIGYKVITYTLDDLVDLADSSFLSTLWAIIDFLNWGQYSAFLLMSSGALIFFIIIKIKRAVID